MYKIEFLTVAKFGVQRARLYNPDKFLGSSWDGWNFHQRFDFIKPLKIWAHITLLSKWRPFEKILPGLYNLRSRWSGPLDLLFVKYFSCAPLWSPFCLKLWFLPLTRLARCVPSLEKASFQLVARKASQKRRHFFLVSFVKMIVFLLVLFSFQQQTPLS